MSDWSRRVGSIEFSPHPRAFVLIFYRIPVNLGKPARNEARWCRCVVSMAEKVDPASNFNRSNEPTGKIEKTPNTPVDKPYTGYSM